MQFQQLDIPDDLIIGINPKTLHNKRTSRQSSNHLWFINKQLDSHVKHTACGVNMPHYNNTCLDITSQATPDPFITYARGRFYFTFTGGDRVPLWEADSITDFFEEGKFKKGPVW